MLEIGTGSAYQAAVLGEPCARGMDDRDRSRVGCECVSRFASLGLTNVHVRRGRWLQRVARAGAIRPHHGDGGPRRNSGTARSNSSLSVAGWSSPWVLKAGRNG